MGMGDGSPVKFPQRRIRNIGTRAGRIGVLAAAGMCLLSCSTSSQSKLLKMPKVPKVKVPKISMPKLENVPLVGKKKPKPEPEALGGGPRAEVKAKPTMKGGTVEFRGFTQAALKDFRLIPETGTDVFEPQNQVYHGVDGFWWKPQQGMWYKIPNHCSVVVKAAPGAVTKSAFTTTSKTGKVGIGLQALRGRAIEPAFYPDSGNTEHPTDYPFTMPPDTPDSLPPDAGAPSEDDPEAFLAP